MELTGRILKVLPLEGGESSKGSWKKQGFVLETMDQMPKKVAFEAWGDDVAQLETIKAGNPVKVYFNVESREYNEKWFTTCRMWKMTKIV